MTIKSKLILLLALPIIGLIAISSKIIITDFMETKILKQLDTGIKLSKHLSALVHETQRERGMTAGYLGSNGKKFKVSLEKQRKLTDEKLNILKRFIRQNNLLKIDKDISNGLTRAMKDISNISKIRDTITNLSLPLVKALKYYTSFNTKLLNTILEITKISNKPIITKQLIAYSNFLFLKERAGIERAVGANSLAKDVFSKGMLVKFNNLISAQNSFMNSFLLYTTKDSKNYYNKVLKGKAIQEVQRIRKVLLTSNEKKVIVSKMKALVGYGGLIHNFKNYVLRGKSEYKDIFYRQYEQLNKLILKYENLQNVSEDEQVLLNNLKCVFIKYNQGLPVVGSAVKRKLSIKKLDEIIQVNDKPAIEALEILSNSFFTNKATYWFKMMTIKIDKLKNVDDYLSEILLKTIDKEVKDTKNNMFYSSIIIFVLILFLIIIAIIILKDIFNKLSDLNNATLDLLSENDENLRIEINSKDEIGIISENINNYLQKIDDSITEDNKLIYNANITIERVKKGCYSEKIEGHTSNKSLEIFKNSVNDMIMATREHFVDINTILEEYVQNDYRNKLKLDNIERGGVFELLVTDINKLRDTITSILLVNKENGLTIDEGSDMLLKNIKILNTNSNSAAAALEQTAAALEEITGNISNNTENVIRMAGFAEQLTNSASEGEKLANQTTNAMNEIDEQVTSINDAITVIDQIAFQTNILSLNAAVEAATAGEAGKGFAVVAQEVRNLATRSAQAAKEIKILVSNAIDKADEGKIISHKMIDGYNGLNENISKTIELITNIESASKEQKLGIEQINDSINSLDNQTQEIASIATKTHDVSSQIDEISKMIVINADEKEFIGKDTVKAKKLNTQILLSQNDIEEKSTNKILAKIIPIVSDKNDDEWTSF